MSETKRECAASYRKPPLHTRFKKGPSGNPRGGPKKNLPALLVVEPAYVATNGRRRKITKREAVIPQLVNESSSAMMRDMERKTEAEPPSEPHGFAHRRSQALRVISFVSSLDRGYSTWARSQPANAPHTTLPSAQSGSRFCGRRQGTTIQAR